MLDDFVEGIRAEWRGRITFWQTLPQRPARWGDWPEGLDPRVVEAAARLGFPKPWIHQETAIRLALEGRNTVVVTPTASGKTLCYNAPVLHELVRNPEARALYLFPTKALAHDQLSELLRWSDALGDFGPAAYDGDTPSSIREGIRNRARVVVSNPDMLHAGILPHHTRWESLFRNLRFVVVDEIHTYRGVFGAHVANVLRRLKRVYRFHGSAPRFACCSATIANPAELAETLLEEPVALVEEDGSPRGERHFVFYNPPIVDRALGLRRSALLEVRKIADRFLSANLQTIVFTQTRQSAEVLLKYIQKDREQASEGPGSAQIRGYRAGYRPSDRRAIERSLQEGEIRGVVSTNALELGIDIGEMSACLLAGYPGTIASTWQRSGRAGRRSGVSFTVMVAGNGPLDQYIAGHPEYFWKSSPEHARLDPDNLLILLDHLACAAFELPFSTGEGFGKAGQSEGAETPAFVAELLDHLHETSRLRRIGDSYYWMSQDYPAQQVNLRAAGQKTVVVSEIREGDPVAIGTVEQVSAPLTVHEGAIYLHEGVTFLVEKLDWEGSRAFVRRVDSDYYTRASYHVKLEPLDIVEEKAEKGACVRCGEVRVTGKASRFRKIRFYTSETLGWGEIDLPEQVALTTAYWFALEDEAVESLRAAGWWQYDPIGYRGKNWQEQRDKVRARDGYRCRLCQAPEEGRQHDIHHVRPFREFRSEGGEDFSVRANELDNLLTLCHACHRRVENVGRFQRALSGLGYVMGHVACLFLMCDLRDIGLLSEAQSEATQKPTLTIYEKIPVGVGFSEALFRMHGEILRTAHELIESCGCERGCPSCVGPVAEEEDTKAYTLAVLKELIP